MTYGAVVLGGGFAGLSAACALAEKGVRVVVLDKKPHLGGRAYSFKDPETGESVDNGQHLFMGCYRETRAFLGRIGTAPLLKFPPGLRVDYADAAGGRDALACPGLLPAPLHLAWGVLGLRGLSLREKWGLRRLDAALRPLARGPLPDALDRLTVRQWLDSLGQSPRIQERFFDPIALGALNDDPKVAAATGFVQVLREIFYRDAEASRLGLSSVGLSELYTAAAREYIERRGGKVMLSKKAVAILEEDGRCRGVELEGGERLAGAVVSTLPPWDLKKLALPQALRGEWENLRPSPIIGVNLWLDRPVMTEPLVGLLGTETHWAFNKSRLWGRNGGGQYLSLVFSGAHAQVGRDPKALLALAEADLSRCLPEFRKAKVLRAKVVKEPFATLSPVPGSDAARPAARSPLPGFVFAGDWTRTGLPATIESAVLSGRLAVEEVLS